MKRRIQGVMNYLKNRLIVVGLTIVSGFLSINASGQQTPTVGTFYSLTLNQPPLPFNPFPELPVYSTGTGAFIYDDSSVNYPLLWAAQAVIQAALETEGGEMMTMSAPPSPGEGGGGGGGGSFSNPPPYSLPGLKLTIPFITNGAVYTSLMEADTNSAYDLFEQFALSTNLVWARIASTEIGTTNFAVTQISPSNAWYRAADTTDTDFDGLSDAYEKWVTKTDPLSPDSDHDGIPDGKEDANLNGIPDAIDYRRLNRAVIFASRTNAYEGGQAGELTILLPAPAPTNSTTITLHLGSYTDYGLDYTLTTTNGLAVTNEVKFAAGQTQTKLNVNAVDDTVQQTRPRRVQVSLASSANYLLDPELCEVNLVDNDLPVISVIPIDPRAVESASGTNRAAFLFRREGSTDGFLGFYFSRTGSAQSGADYVLTNASSGYLVGEGQPVLFEPGSNTLVITLTALPDALFEGEETATLTILPTGLSGFATIDTNAQSATVTIADCDEPPAVSFEGTDLLATEYNLKSATVTLRRVGCALGPMQVPLAISGTAVNDIDYRLVTNNVVMTNAIVTFPAGANTVVLNVAPLIDGVEEQAEKITFTIKGSVAYTIGSSNSVTVWLDDAQPTRYQVVPIQPATVYNADPNFQSPAVYEVYRYGQSSAAALVPFLLQTNLATTNSYLLQRTGDLDATKTNLVFAPFATRAQLRVQPIGPNLTNHTLSLQVPLAGAGTWFVYLRPPWEFAGISIEATNAVEGTTTYARVRVSRNATGPALNVPLHFGGSATPGGIDYNLSSNLALTIPASALFVETNIVANSDGLFEGWEAVAVIPNLPVPNNLSLYNWNPQFLFLRDNVANADLLPGGDADQDGLPDKWEYEHGLDPLDPTDAQLDPDKDGLTNLDEYQFNTNPNDADTDHDGQKDFVQRYRPEPSADYLAIRLRTLDTGKVNNGANCAVCHTTRLKAGDNSHFAPTHGQPAEQIFSFRKGNTYPIWLQEISRNLLPTTNTGNTPTTTAKYNANILPATDALPAGFVVQDPNAKLGTNQPWTNFPTDPTVPIGTLIVPKIEVTWADVPNSTAFDTNSNVGGGYRFYPDQHSPTDTVDRRNLILRVKTTPALPGQKVRLRSLDVDDPLPWEKDDKEYSIDPNDRTTGFHGNDNRGATPTTPQAGQLLETVLTLDNQGQAETDFFVTLQPGDNFRVAAVLDTPGASNHLYSLQVDNITAPLYVTPDQEEVEGFVGGLSPMLTVWRKLHLEFDSMGAPPTNGPEANYVNASINVFRPNYPAQGRSEVAVVYSGTDDGPGLFDRGKLEILGVGTFAISNSWTLAYLNGRAGTTLEIIGVPSGITNNHPVKLYDDDDRYLANDPLYPSNLGLQNPPLPAFAQINPFLQAAQLKYGAAYITLVDANAQGWNTQSNIVFKKQEAAYSIFGTVFDNGNLQLKGTDRPEFWAFSLVFGYQPTRLDDGDPDAETPLSGGTPETSKNLPVGGNWPFGYSVVFVEAIRDYEFGVRKDANVPRSRFTDAFWAPRLAQQYSERIYSVAAHEIGHAPGRQSEGGDHDEDGVMIEGAPQSLSGISFSPRSVARFRGAKHWTQ